jgi:hypothetical protein
MLMLFDIFLINVALLGISHRRESVCDVITIRYDPVHGVSPLHLTEQLSRYSNRKVKIGTFSAASNVTGSLSRCYNQYRFFFY